MLRYVEYVPERMVDAVRRRAEGAVTAGRLTNEQMRTLLHITKSRGAATPT